jgi:hypothetical protein
VLESVLLDSVLKSDSVCVSMCACVRMCEYV